jgi:hypothetical protein
MYNSIEVCSFILYMKRYGVTEGYMSFTANYVQCIKVCNFIWYMKYYDVTESYEHSRRLRVASGATAPGPALEGAPRFRPKVVLISLSGYILR